MRLSEIKGFENVTPFLLKFSDKREHLESLQNGNLYMNNFKYFIELEKKTGIKGMGDMFEVANVLNNIKLSFYDYETNEFLFEADAKRMHFRFDETVYKPVFCLFALGSDMLEVVNEGENFIDTKIIFSEEQKERILKEFGRYVLVIPWKLFMDNVFKSFRENGYVAIGDFVRYSNYSVNYSKRIEAFINQTAEMFFWKDSYFEHQREFRIVILNENIETPLTVKFESIKENTMILRTQDLLSGEYGIKFHNKEN